MSARPAPDRTRPGPVLSESPRGFRPSDVDLAVLVHEDAIRCFRAFLLVPTIGRYARVVKPASHPAAAKEIALQVLQCCDADCREVDSLLSERYPSWSSVLRDARNRSRSDEAADRAPLAPDSCGPVLSDGGRRFTVGPQVAAGSNGMVCRARDRCIESEEPGSEHRVVVKLLHDETSSDGSWLREAEIAATVGSPCGIRVVDSGIAPNGHGYVVMERVDGLTLIAMAAAERMIPPRHAGAELAHLASALESLHARGLGHGDIHPANVMMDRVGHLRLLDYGNGEGASADHDVRALCALGLWMTLGYLPQPGAIIPWQWSPMRAAVVEAAVDALNNPRTAGDLGQVLRKRMRRARIRRNMLTTLLMGLFLTVLLYLAASGHPHGPGARHAAVTDSHQADP